MVPQKTDSDCRRVITKETGVSIGLIIVIVSAVLYGVYYFGKIHGQVNTNVKKIDNNQRTIQELKGSIDNLPTRREFQNLRGQVEVTNKRLEELKNYLMK